MRLSEGGEQKMANPVTWFEITGKDGKVYGHRSGLCLETQHFPDSPNKPNFPSVVLKSGQEFQSTTVYRLTTKK